jgi:hypothetical protein
MATDYSKRHGRCKDCERCVGKPVIYRWAPGRNRTLRWANCPRCGAPLGATALALFVRPVEIRDETPRFARDGE